MESIKCHELTIDLDNKLCYLNDEELSLSKKEFEILYFFIQNPNKVIDREELLSKFWIKQVDIRTVDTTISRLRKKLNTYGERIRTRTGFGYSFCDK